MSSPALGETGVWKKRRKRLHARTPHLKYSNFDDHGFVVLDLTPARVHAEYVYTESPQVSSGSSWCGAAFDVASGTNRVERVVSDRCPASNGASSRQTRSRSTSRVATVSSTSSAPSSWSETRSMSPASVVPIVRATARTGPTRASFK